MKHLTVFFQRVIIYCVIFRERRKIRSAYVTIAQNLKPKEWLYAVLSLGFIVLQVWLELLLPDYMQKITALAISNAGMAEIWKNGGIMLACALGSALGAVIVGYFTARIAAALSYRLRGQLFEKVESFSHGRDQ